MLKKLIFALAILSECVVSVYAVEVPDVVQKEIKNALEKKAFKHFDSTIFSRKNFSFKPLTDISKIKPGKPIAYYEIDIDSLKNMPANLTIDVIIGLSSKQPPKRWAIPLIIDGVIEEMMLIDCQGDSCSYGGMVYYLAKEWEKVTQAWPDSSKYNPILICIPNENIQSLPNRLNFYHIIGKSKDNLTALSRRSLEHDEISDYYDKVHVEADSIAKIRNYDKYKADSFHQQYYWSKYNTVTRREMYDNSQQMKTIQSKNYHDLTNLGQIKEDLFGGIK